MELGNKNNSFRASLAFQCLALLISSCVSHRSVGVKPDDFSDLRCVIVARDPHMKLRITGNLIHSGYMVTSLSMYSRGDSLLIEPEMRACRQGVEPLCPNGVLALEFWLPKSVNRVFLGTKNLSLFERPINNDEREASAPKRTAVTPKSTVIPITSGLREGENFLDTLH